MIIGGSATVASDNPHEVTRALQQAMGPTYSPTTSGAPTLDSTSANTATNTNEGTNAGTADSSVVGTADGTVVGTADGTNGGTTGDEIINSSTSSTMTMTGTGATLTTEATGSGTATTTDAAATSDSESWMVCQQDLATLTSLNTDDTLTFYHYVALAPEGDSRGGILCGRLERNDGTDGWIGFGMSPDGEMDDGIGIIGLPDDGTVEKYWLNGENPMVERMSDDKQTLMFSSITQDQDGTTIMEFTKFLNEADELPILANGDNIFLYALGGSNELGYHSSGMSSFTLDLKTPAASSSTSTSATTNSAVTTETSSTTFAIEGETSSFSYAYHLTLVMYRHVCCLPHI